MNGSLDESRVDLLRQWLKAGYELGNHTYSHPNYHKTSFENFTEDILKGERVTKPLSKEYGVSYQFFRHPYLRIGKTKSSADSLSHFLAHHGYTESPVTIDPNDYLFAKTYHIALQKGDTLKASKVAVAYLKHVEDKIKFYETIAIELFDRNISHTLLIHANLLNADYLDEIAELFKQQGYSFVSQEEVLRDKVYSSLVTKYGDWGMSWMDLWAMNKGKNALLRDDPKIPEFVLK
ncbi:MAG: polysaccharide deacetylase family protein [Bacteroidota bacterium]